MQSKILSFNRGILIQDVRNVGWVGLAYFLCLVLFLPIKLLQDYTNEDPYRPFLPPDSLFLVSRDFQTFITFLFPVLLAIFLFRYMQVKGSSDFIHSLPIKRNQLFMQHLFTGFVLLLLPVILNGFLLYLLSFVVPAPELLSLSSVVSWTLLTSLFTIFTFSLSVFVGMLTGLSILQGAFAYILLFLPIGLATLIMANLELHLFGFTESSFFDQQIFLVLLPLYRFRELGYHSLPMIELISYILLVIGFLISALFMYQKRPVESASDPIVFRFLRPIFIYGFTFCWMLVGGLYFSGTQGQFSWILFGYITASILSYFVAQMILEKSWRVFSKWKGYILYLLIASGLGWIIQIDGFGYETRIPAEQDIDSVYFGEAVYLFDEEENSRFFEYENQYVKQGYHYEESGSMEEIRYLHQQIIADKKLLEHHPHSTDFRPVAFRYQLKNGKELTRAYNIPLDSYKMWYRNIVELEEYKMNQNPVLTLEESDLNDVTQIKIESYDVGTQVIIPAEDAREFHDLIQQEIENESYDDLISNKTWSSLIEYQWPDQKHLRVPWRKSYEEIDTWLNEKGLLSNARITSDKIEYAIIIKMEDNKELYHYYDDYTFRNEIEQYEGAIKIDDKKVLDEMLRQTTHDAKADYIVAYFHERSYPHLIEVLHGKDAPASILEQF